jgi:hypothetical protein
VPGAQASAHASSNDGVPEKHTISTRLITRRGNKVTIRVYPANLPLSATAGAAGDP